MIPYISPAYLGNSFTCIQYRTCYMCSGPIFRCEFNRDVNLVTRLAEFGNLGNWSLCICIRHWFSMWNQLWCQFGDWTNQIWQFGELVHMYMHSALIFNVDPTAMSIWSLDQPNLVIWGIGTHVYAFSTNFQCETSECVECVEWWYWPCYQWQIGDIKLKSAQCTFSSNVVYVHSLILGILR
jgi:hypothetical protein